MTISILDEALRQMQHPSATMDDPLTAAQADMDDQAAHARECGACTELQAKVEADVAYATGIDWGLLFVAVVAVGAIAAAVFQIFPMGFALELP